MSGWPHFLLPIRVIFQSREKEDVEILGFLVPEAIRAINEVIGREVFCFDPTSSQRSQQRFDVCVPITLVPNYKAHGATIWPHNLHKRFTEPESTWKKHRNQFMQIPLHLRRKSDVPIRRRMYEYYSTLTHELIHCLGFGHFPLDKIFSKEIMYPKCGGTPIPEIPQEILPFPIDHPDDLPPLKKSPITRAALKWMFEIPPNGEQGMRVYCKRCFQTEFI
eukprot:TRINITY_DN14827_c0_g1_i1.p1 TRINITY_DN14827_c0_g1~~TRINITY_DN14827_c0_g1_i1.p1  ORF type:complete len:233 (-),score=46.76 TRINITY_DN14827_c0_g1_i1:20-679(-)